MRRDRKSVCASDLFNVEEFGCERTRRLTYEEINARFRELKSYSHFEEFALTSRNAARSEERVRFRSVQRRRVRLRTHAAINLRRDQRPIPRVEILFALRGIRAHITKCGEIGRACALPICSTSKSSAANARGD